MKTMDFQFDPTFSLLPKFGMGFRPVPTSREEIELVSNYLGVDLPAADVEENARRLGDELESQNGFLAKNLESEPIYHSDEYRRSKFIRDPADAKEIKGIVLKSVAVADGFHILVGADASRMSGSFMIGLMKKFTYEPLESS